MKTDKLLHLIQQKNVVRSGGALPLPLPKHQYVGPTGAQQLAQAQLNEANSMYQPSETSTNVPTQVQLLNDLASGKIARNRKQLEEKYAKEIASGKGKEKFLGMFDIPVNYSGISKQNAETLGKKAAASDIAQPQVYKNLAALATVPFIAGTSEPALEGSAYLLKNQMAPAISKLLNTPLVQMPMTGAAITPNAILSGLMVKEGLHNIPNTYKAASNFYQYPSLETGLNLGVNLGLDAINLSPIHAPLSAYLKNAPSRQILNSMLYTGSKFAKPARSFARPAEALSAKEAKFLLEDGALKEIMHHGKKELSKHALTELEDQDENNQLTHKLGGPSPAKAREMLHDKSAHGHPLTDAQRRYFGWIASQKKQEGGSKFTVKVRINK